MDLSQAAEDWNRRNDKRWDNEEQETARLRQRVCALEAEVARLRAEHGEDIGLRDCTPEERQAILDRRIQAIQNAHEITQNSKLHFGPAKREQEAT